MAVDIDAFKADLDQLKNQRSVIQAKLDEANRHVTELMETLKGMGFNSVEEAKQAYVRQCQDAEQKHAQVKQLLEEIKQVDAKVPSREEVMERLKSLDQGQFTVETQATISGLSSNGSGLVYSEGPSLVAEEPMVPHDAVGELPTSAFESPQPMQQLTSTNESTINKGEPDLGQMLFASL